jgi:hypothetical protein
MDLGTVPTVWYFLFYFSIGSRNCSDGVVFIVFHFICFPIFCLSLDSDSRKNSCALN